MNRILLCIGILCVHITCLSQSTFKTNKNYFSITTSPAYFILGGYGVKAFYNLPERWSFGLQVDGSFDLPSFAKRQFFENDDHFDVHWDYALGAEVRYRFNKKDNDLKGLYLLATAGYEGWTINTEADEPVVAGTNQRDKFENWFTSVGAGYNWFPFRRHGLHLGASYGIIFILKKSDTRYVNGKPYEIRSVVPPSFAPNIYLGWRFGKSTQ